MRHLPTFDIAKVDKLETDALAMFCAQADYKAATDPPASVAELVNAAVATRASSDHHRSNDACVQLS